MALELDESTREFIREHRVAHLATADLDGQPAVIPVCYAFDGERLYSPVDEKPKRVAPRRLKRVRNIEANPRIALVIDDYSEDWAQLAYVLISGLAEVLEPDDGAGEHARAVALLREKYPPYRAMKIEQRPVIKITPIRIKQWKAGA
jgi:PPOX class probable F420-dependent enzyme